MEPVSRAWVSASRVILVDRSQFMLTSFRDRFISLMEVAILLTAVDTSEAEAAALFMLREIPSTNLTTSSTFTDVCSAALARLPIEADISSTADAMVFYILAGFLGCLCSVIYGDGYLLYRC